jgi:5-oxopent-3-ene-1,2,5-tricarboxylate decarboxylase/2-hydroxyhepta-2,4-diene-1,7-dioate isomerase
MKHARVAWSGAIHDATPAAREGFVRLADGRVVAEDAVVWLPPFAAGSVIALGLNYADHAKELSFKAQDEPLVFLKGPGALIGHRGQTRRPAGATFMHYECELAVVIGKPAYRVARARAMEHVAGYTVANDYAIRDYLENWYRPNLRVKNRDGATALGPWLVDAADVAAPPELALRTLVNGKQTQTGNTRDLVFPIDVLIEYLSAFMTLDTGDVILTGTPEGVVNVDVGDEVVCEIEGIGRLRNTIVGDDVFGRTGEAKAKVGAKEAT